MVNLLSINILHLPYGCDQVSIETDLPDSAFPFKGHLFLNFGVAKDGAEEYVKEHFPDVPISAITRVERNAHGFLGTKTAEVP